MLASLFQGSKSVPNLESRTEEDHSRSLLWPSPSVDLPRTLALSPPSTPLTSPTFRTGPYDDRGGLELNDLKDARIIVAQDAFGTMDRPMVLFDSHKQPHLDSTGKPMPTSSTAPKPALPSPQKSPSLLFNAQQRNRSTTISGPASAWSRPSRETESNDKVNRLLDCMFGVTSATKSESSTKMHVLLAGQDQLPSQSQVSPSAFQKQQPARAPLIRARTSTQIASTQKAPRISKEDTAVAEDIILVTRMFTVALPEAKERLPNPTKNTADLPGSQGLEAHVDTAKPEDGAINKRPKLIEKKVPMFAVAIMLQLPPDDSKRNVSRPVSRTSLASSSFPNSFGSEIASSWSLLEAIPDSLGSSTHSHKATDRRIEHITNIWDVILRSLSHLEHTSRVEIERLLQDVNRHMLTSATKTPKGPYEQRTNQRNIYLRNAFSHTEMQKMDRAARQTQRRICLALRIPKAVTGTGFVEGHWLDEARYLVQICGSKTQSFFLFNLLTAFLGNHTEWLEKIGFDWCKKQGHVLFRRAQKSTSVSSRTIIIAERRSLARRLIFLLASFLPSPQGVNAFEMGSATLKSPLHTPGLSSTSPRNSTPSQTMAKNIANRHNRAQHVSFGTADFVGLGTSVSSTGSVGSRTSSKVSRPQVTRKDSDTTSVRDLARVPTSQSSIHVRKASTTDPATTPLPATPMPFLTTKRAGYFEEQAIENDSESKAIPGLQDILRKESSSFAPSSVSSTWGSILGGLWAKRHEGANSASAAPAIDHVSSPRKHASNASISNSTLEGTKLQAMVQEATGVDMPRGGSPGRTVSGGGQGLFGDASSHVGSSIEPPRLRVDEQDGVVDVDVGIPGFLGWDGESGPMSPSRPQATSSSVRSFDGPASLHSSFSQSFNRSKTPRSVNPNVAGYLKRYHEDFSLQAVGYYDELGTEIKRSMSREPTPVDTFCMDKQPDTGDSGGSEWISVSSTLVADARKFSIERLTLQRKRIVRPRSRGMHQPTSLTEVFQASPEYEERFILEPVMVFDETLTDAIEGILDTPTRMSGTSNTVKPGHSRTPSNTATPFPLSTPPLSVGFFGSKDQLTTRTDCRQVVAEALEEVVKSVNNDLAKNAGNALTHTNTARGGLPEPQVHQDNVLREGVKKWLLNVDHVQQREVW